MPTYVLIIGICMFVPFIMALVAYKDRGSFIAFNYRPISYNACPLNIARNSFTYHYNNLIGTVYQRRHDIRYSLNSQQLNSDNTAYFKDPYYPGE